MKVASYNIRKAIGTDRRRSPERILEVLSEIDADVVALQEADRRFGVRSAVLPDWLIAAHSPYLVRAEHEILCHDVIHLPCLEPRGAVSAQLRVHDKVVQIIGMHLDLSGLWRRKQAAAVMHYLEMHRPAGSDAAILMGDLNEWTQRGCIADFGRALRFAPCGRSFHARRPLAALDRIMWRGDLDLADSGVHASPMARRASDHLPIWARFTPA
jgi:endonuclease/exonuclease/phosphatase family metal-dependent hydrolase